MSDSYDKSVNEKPERGKRQKVFSAGRAVIGGIIVIAGVLLLLDNMGFDTDMFWRLWPLAFIVVGVAKMLGPQSSSSKTFGALLIGLGFILLFDLWNLWPILVIFFGLHILWRSVGRSGVPQKGRTVGDHQYLREFVIFGGSEKKITSNDFRGGDITAVFGGVELDLREADMGTQAAVIDCFVMFGGLELRIPEDWEVVSETQAIFGSVEDKAHTEDPQPGASTAKRLVVRGYVLFGGIEVKN